MKTVKEILVEFHLYKTMIRVKQLEDVAPSVVITNLNKELDDIRINGMKFAGEVRGWMKSFFAMEVQSQPLLIKDGNDIIGIALPIGWDKHNDTVRDYIAYRWDEQYKRYEFSHTVSPAFRALPSRGSFPKKVVEKNYQLQICTEITHLQTFINLQLVYEKWDKIEGGMAGTIRTVPENYWVASITEEGKIVFDSWEKAIKDVNLDGVEDMWKRGLIHKK